MHERPVGRAERLAGRNIVWHIGFCESNICFHSITSRLVKREGAKNAEEVVIRGPQRMGQNFSDKKVMNEVANLELMLSN